VDVPGFGEPRKSACFVFSLCLLSVQYAQQIGIRALGKLKHIKKRFSALCSKLQNFQSSQILLLTSCGDSSRPYESGDIKIVKIGVETSPVELAAVSPEICRKNQSVPEFSPEKTATSSDT
jgi:hypothetical protein